MHEQYTAQDIRDFRDWKPRHPHYRASRMPPPDVVAESDFSGSTKGILDICQRTSGPNCAMLGDKNAPWRPIFPTRTRMSNFIGPCNMCPYMKKITLEKVLWSLHSMTTEITVPEDVADKARLAVQRHDRP